MGPRETKTGQCWTLGILIPLFNGVNSVVWEFLNFSTKKIVLKSQWEIQEGKVRSALVEEKSSVRALSKAHEITLKR